MSSTTFVSRRVMQALGASVKPTPSVACNTLSRLSKGSPQSRPLYTAVHAFGSASVMAEITSVFPTQYEYIPNLMDPIRPFCPKEIVFLGGAPGAGKGTNSKFIAEQRGFGAPTVVVSDLLNTPACKALKDQGVMVDDEFVFKTLLKELENPIYRNGVVVDGFPRTAKQAEYIKNFYNQNNSILSHSPKMFFVMLHVDEAASVERQQIRGQKTIILNKERVANSLPPIEVRVTDTTVEASKARYAIFKEQLKAVLGLGQMFPLVVVDASAPINKVQSNIATHMATLPRY